MALIEIKKLKNRLNAKEKSKQRKENHFQVGSGSKAVAMMEPQARAERERSRAEKEQKKQAERTKKDKQAEKENEDSERRAELASGRTKVEYSGNLKSMKKVELEDIAHLLAIKGYDALTNDVLRSKIKDCLLSRDETYRRDARFSKLFIVLDRDIGVGPSSGTPLEGIAQNPVIRENGLQRFSGSATDVDMFPEPATHLSINDHPHAYTSEMHPQATSFSRPTQGDLHFVASNGPLSDLGAPSPLPLVTSMPTSHPRLGPPVLRWPDTLSSHGPGLSSSSATNEYMFTDLSTQPLQNTWYYTHVP